MPNDNVQWAVLTGASRGIGKETAKMLAAKGFGIILLARSQKALSVLSEEIREQGGKSHYLSIDLSKEEEIADAQSFFASFGGKIGLLVHNAGIVKVGAVANMDPADWQTMQDVNVRAPFLLTRLLLPLLARPSQIIFINSVAGLRTFAEWGAYSVSKFGLKALADTLRQEVAAEGIRITSIFPASVDTPLQDTLPYNWERKNMLRPVDVARAVSYCAEQPAHVLINEVHLENNAGIF